MSKLTYKDSGVDIDAGNEFVELIRPLVESTYDSSLRGSFGSFSGAYLLDIKKYRQPLLVSSTDGVGTKLKVAFMADKYDTIGIDLVAMCVNDILTCGATPLFFLDYLATSKLIPNQAKLVIEGIVKGCKEAGCVLLGGETAEMPEFYKEKEFDLAGFSVGVVDSDKVIDGSRVEIGDVLVGIASSGLHSNGYSLARKVLFGVAGYSLDDKPSGLSRTIGEELLVPTMIYVRPVLDLCSSYRVKAISHITGGGLVENIPRSIPPSYSVKIYKNSWWQHPIFLLIKEKGKISEEEMFRTFNCGIGMVVTVSKEEADGVVDFLDKRGMPAYKIGEVIEGRSSSPRVLFIE